MTKTFFISFFIGIAGGLVFVMKLMPHMPFNGVLKGLAVVAGFEAGFTVVFLVAIFLMAAFWSP